jgi:hypothetical protein
MPMQNRGARNALSTGAPSHIAVRATAVPLACILGVYCLWLLVAELSRPKIHRLPTDPQSAAVAAKDNAGSNWAAWIARFRGDLWAESAFTSADLLWADRAGTDPSQVKSLAEVTDRLRRAIRYAPTNAGVWLLAAGLAAKYGWPKPRPAEMLRMSYFTGPSELRLMPLRLTVAMSLPALDPDLEQLADRDLRVLLAHQQKRDIMEAYRSATPAQKHFIERAVGAIEPDFVDSLQRGQE